LFLELHGQPGIAGPVVAYSTLQCTSFGLLMPGARAAGAKPVTPEQVIAATRGLTPISTVLTGARGENGAITFRVDKTMGGGDMCAMSAATVTSFGVRQIAFEGKDAACGNWNMLLTKAGL